ncbi:hydantoinase/oxoprolinase family protein [Schlesneria paludicola]|uniref:hydantoinase/oxoprolinase family protein n=1 Tax=Schlesneria paludicola TaxID=360056 RepID=UPI00029AA77E|nr:hydantoinase/oxoprolinase family protein [Schlesneria paludicola]
MAILGLDIGGANIKAADGSGHAISRPFAIWQVPERLPDELTQVFQSFPHTDRIALTMTAELADCFVTKSEGVRFILEAVESSLNRLDLARNTATSGNPTDGADRIFVWTTDGHFVGPRLARDYVRKVSAANWHALATWCGDLIPAGSGLLVDIGTTTTDIIPLVAGKPVPVGLTDIGRLQSGELSYSGVWRTPLCSVAHSVPFREGYCTLAAELFATTLDIHLLLGLIPEDAHDLGTADGRPATKAAAYDRLARMLCCDRHEISYDEVLHIAKFLADVQRHRLSGALERVALRLPSKCENVIVAGSGNFLAFQMVYENRHTSSARIVSLAEQTSPEIASAACAHAVAQLATRPEMVAPAST